MTQALLTIALLCCLLAVPFTSAATLLDDLQKEIQRYDDVLVGKIPGKIFNKDSTNSVNPKEVLHKAVNSMVVNESSAQKPKGCFRIQPAMVKKVEGFPQLAQVTGRINRRLKEKGIDVKEKKGFCNDGKEPKYAAYLRAAYELTVFAEVLAKYAGKTGYSSPTRKAIEAVVGVNLGKSKPSMELEEVLSVFDPPPPLPARPNPAPAKVEVLEIYIMQDYPGLLRAVTCATEMTAEMTKRTTTAVEAKKETTAVGQVAGFLGKGARFLQNVVKATDKQLKETGEFFNEKYDNIQKGINKGLKQAEEYLNDVEDANTEIQVRMAKTTEVDVYLDGLCLPERELEEGFDMLSSAMGN